MMYRKGTIGLFLLYSVFMFTQLPTVSATTITVSNETDLINAITTANTNAEDDVIVLDTNITLTGALNIDATYGRNGLPPIMSDSGHKLVIDGDGFIIERDNGFTNCASIPHSSGVIADAFRILQINAGADVTLVNLTLQNGCANDSTHTFPTYFFNDGGAIFNNGTLAMFDVTLVDNTAETRGGGLFNNGTVTAIANLTATNNTTMNSNGGVIYNADTINLIANSTFTSNDAISQQLVDASSFGGAITTQGLITTITNSTFDNNTAGDSGGAIFVSGAGTITTIANSSFTNNDAETVPTATKGVGGAISVAGMVGRISNVTFDTNTAARGGAVALNGNGTITLIEQSTFKDNAATFNHGGAIVVPNNGQIGTIVNSTFNGNTSSSSTIGVLNGGTISTIRNTTLANNTSSNNRGTDLYVFRPSGTVTTIDNVIMADATAGSNCRNRGNITNFTSNLVEVNDTNACTSPSFSTDPGLGALTNNGGITDTQVPTNVVINTGNNANCPTIDQRGGFRNDGQCDVGAVEVATVVTPTVYFTTTASNVAEGNSINVEVVLDIPSGGVFGDVVTVYVVDVQNGTATDVTDYTYNNVQTVTFDCSTGCTNSILSQSVTLTARNDNITDIDETVNLQIVGIDGSAIFGNDLNHTLTITDILLASPTSNTSSGNNAPTIAVFDPAISKIGFLVPGQVGVTGEQLEWVVTVTNTGNVVGNNVTVTDTLLDALQIDNVDAPSGNVSINGQTVSVTYPALNVGESVQFSIFTTVLQGASVTNTACVNASNQGAEECATGSAVSQLPVTGETPFGKNWLIAGLLLAVSFITGFGIMTKKR